jgi:energy-converting hydrogenase Eha subunit H
MDFHSIFRVSYIDHGKGMGINFKALLLRVFVIGGTNIAKSQVYAVKADSIEVARCKLNLQ